MTLCLECEGNFCPYCVQTSFQDGICTACGGQPGLRQARLGRSVKTEPRCAQCDNQLEESSRLAVCKACNQWYCSHCIRAMFYEPMRFEWKDTCLWCRDQTARDYA